MWPKFVNRERVDGIRFFIGVTKDIFWVIGGIVAAVALVIVIVKKDPTNLPLLIILGVVSLVLLFLIFRTVAYRKKNKTIYRSFSHFSDSVAAINKQLGEELRYLEQSFPTGTSGEYSKLDIGINEEEFVTRQSVILARLLKKILDSTEGMFTQLSGCKCTAVLLLPENSMDDGDHFRSKLYSSNVSQKRTDTSMPHRSGLLSKAWTTDHPLLYPDLRKELGSGDFVKSRPEKDPLRWYRSAIIGKFFVKGEPFGILSVDTLDGGALIDDYIPLFVTYAELCGITFSLIEHGDLGNAN